MIYTKKLGPFLDINDYLIVRLTSCNLCIYALSSLSSFQEISGMGICMYKYSRLCPFIINNKSETVNSEHDAIIHFVYADAKSREDRKSN